MRVEEILGKIIEIPFFIFFILTLSRWRFSMKGTALVTAAIAVPYMLTGYIIIRNFHLVIYAYPALDLAYRFGNIFLMAMTAFCLARQRLVQAIFLMASAYVTITVTEVLALALYTAFSLPEIIAKCLVYLTIALLIYLARKPSVSILSQTKKGWWLLCSVPLFLIGCFLLISSVPATLAQSPGRIPAALILCGTTVIIYITFFYMMWQLYKQNQLEQNVIALRLSVGALENENELIQQNEKKYALFRHDLRHMTQMLSASLAKGDVSGAMEWLAPLTQNVNTPVYYNLRTFTGHTMPDAVLSRYIGQARESGIDISVRIDPAEKLAVDMAELAVVLANALENAVRACREIPDGKQRIIRLDGRQRGAQFFLEIANTYTGSVCIDPERGIPTHKGNTAEHGFGSQSIAFFAEKNNAALQYQVEDGWFRLRLLMDSVLN